MCMGFCSLWRIEGVVSGVYGVLFTVVYRGGGGC